MSSQPTADEQAETVRQRAVLVALLEAKEPKRYIRETWIEQFEDAQWWWKSKIYQHVQQRYGS